MDSQQLVELYELVLVEESDEEMGYQIEVKEEMGNPIETKEKDDEPIFWIENNPFEFEDTNSEDEEENEVVRDDLEGPSYKSKDEENV